MSRAELQQLCGENKHRLPNDFDCRWSTPILEAALHRIGALPPPTKDDLILNIPYIQGPIPLGLPMNNEARIDFKSHSVEHPHIIINQILHKLNIVLIRRLSILNRSIYKGTLNDYFWRKHVQSTMKLRHTDKVIEGITIGAPKKWRSYALMKEPRIAKGVYYIVKIDGHLHETDTKSRSIKQYITNSDDTYMLEGMDDTYMLEGNDRLTWMSRVFEGVPIPLYLPRTIYIENVDKFVDASYVYTIRERKFVRKLLGTILNTGQFLLREFKGDPMIYPHPDTIVDVTSIDQLIVLITVHGEVVLTDIKFKHRHLLDTQVSALKVVGSKLSSVKNIYIIYVIGVDGSFWRYRIEVGNLNVISISSKKQHSFLPRMAPRIVDIKIIYDEYSNESIMVLSDKGEVFVMGKNANHVFGLPIIGYIDEFTRRPLSNITKIFLTDQYSLVVTDGGEVIFSGSLNAPPGKLGGDIIWKKIVMERKVLDIVCYPKSIDFLTE